MILYHGTQSKFRFPKLALVLRHKDFGSGFYLTPDRMMALNWSWKRNKLSHDVRANVYDMPDDWLEIAIRQGLKVKVFEKADREGASFVHKSREEEGFEHGYDLLVGSVADNDIPGYFALVRRGEATFDVIADCLEYRKFKGV